MQSLMHFLPRGKESSDLLLMSCRSNKRSYQDGDTHGKRAIWMESRLERKRWLIKQISIRKLKTISKWAHVRYGAKQQSGGTVCRYILIDNKFLEDLLFEWKILTVTKYRDVLLIDQPEWSIQYIFLLSEWFGTFRTSVSYYFQWVTILQERFSWWN